MTETNSLLKRRWLVNWLGIAVLLLGLVCAGGVYWIGEHQVARHSNDRQVGDSESRDDTLPFEDSKTSSRSTEIYFGKIGVLISTWFRLWEGLENFQRLAVMITMSTVLAASICFLVARRLQ
jgi:hypothetical protein